MFSSKFQSPISTPLPAMASLSDRRRVLPASDAEPQLSAETDSVSNNHREKQRRVAGRNSPRPRPVRQRSFKRDFERVAAETYLITRLTFTLLQYLGYTLISFIISVFCFFFKFISVITLYSDIKLLIKLSIL